jgi:hypothetical protein
MVNSHRATRALAIGVAAALTACGGGSNPAASSQATAQSVSMPILMSDASSEDWATIGVKLLAITLTASDGSTTTVFSSSAGVPVNLAQLDQIGELLSNASVPVGTYTAATLSLSANAGDVTLTASANPESGFPLAAGTTVPSDQIQIQGAQGASGAQTVNVPVKFPTPLVVSANGNNALNLEVDLSHPAFIVQHIPVGGSPLWAVNFRGPVRHHPLRDVRELVLRHLYGQVSAVAADNATLTLAREMPAMPITQPETAVATGTSIDLKVDATNGTLFTDLDAKTTKTITSFASIGSLAGTQLRVAARYQQDGSLVATRIWAASSFNTVWLSPEGHVLRVDRANNQLLLADESGHPVSIAVDDVTQFYFRTPANALADATPIGTGTAFLANLVRGFKVHVQVADPLAAHLVAQSVDIETAGFSGKIANPTNSGFNYVHNFANAGDNYNVALKFIDAQSSNGDDGQGNAVTGFKFWNFAFPTQVDSGSSAVSDFVSAVGGGVDFGGIVGSFKAHGVTYARWGDTANASGWSAPSVVLQPSPVPLGLVNTGWANNSFTMTVVGGTKPVTVDVDTATGSAALVYQVDRSNGHVTVTPEDVSTSAGLAALTQGLQSGAAVKVSAVPQPDGSLKAYVLTYFTGMQPGQ